MRNQQDPGYTKQLQWLMNRNQGQSQNFLFTDSYREVLKWATLQVYRTRPKSPLPLQNPVIPTLKRTKKLGCNNNLPFSKKKIQSET